MVDVEVVVNDEGDETDAVVEVVVELLLSSEVEDGTVTSEEIVVEGNIVVDVEVVLLLVSLSC